MRHTTQQLVLPAVHLHKPLLIVTQRQPLIAPWTRANGIRVSAARWRGIQTNLPLDLPLRSQAESSNVAREAGTVGARGGEEIAATMRAEDDIGAVHLGVEGCERGRDEGVRLMRVDWHVGCGIDEVEADSVARFHQHVEIGVLRADFHPARVVIL